MSEVGGKADRDGNQSLAAPTPSLVLALRMLAGSALRRS